MVAPQSGFVTRLHEIYSSTYPAKLFLVVCCQRFHNYTGVFLNLLQNSLVEFQFGRYFHLMPFYDILNYTTTSYEIVMVIYRSIIG